MGGLKKGYDYFDPDVARQRNKKDEEDEVVQQRDDDAPKTEPGDIGN